MNLDLELYIDLLQSELKRLKEKIKELEQPTSIAPEIPPRPVRQGAAFDPIHVDETKLSPETKEHFQTYMHTANSHFQKMLSMDSRP